MCHATLRVPGKQAHPSGCNGDRAPGPGQAPPWGQGEEVLPAPGFLTSSFWDWHKASLLHHHMVPSSTTSVSMQSDNLGRNRKHVSGYGVLVTERL